MSTNDKLVLNTIFNPFLPLGSDNEDNGANNNVEIIERPEDVMAKDLELQAINAANSSDFDNSLKLLNEAISIAPKRASGYNNRAQVHRIKGNIEDALLDLDRAIILSDGKGYVARQAYCQRGLIYLFRNEEKNAIEDIKISAKLGNEFAKQLITQMNPYAALCNKMLKDMIQKLRNGEQD